jgi:hypothetical protein
MALEGNSSFRGTGLRVAIRLNTGSRSFIAHLLLRGVVVSPRVATPCGVADQPGELVTDAGELVVYRFWGQIHHPGNLDTREFLPGSEQHDFAFRRPKTIQSGTETLLLSTAHNQHLGTIDVASRFTRDTVFEATGPIHRATAIANHIASNSIEPKTTRRATRNLIEPTPNNQKHFRDRIIGL